MGVQDSSRYAVDFDGVYYSESIVSLDAPGPEYEFLNINYWQGNPYFRMPIGLKFKEALIVEMLVPEVNTPNSQGYNNFMNKLTDYTKANFTVPSSGVYFDNSKSTPELSSFSWNRTNKGMKITVTGLDRYNMITKQYRYTNCFFEKILPLKFDASRPEAQTITMSFLVGGMETPPK